MHSPLDKSFMAALALSLLAFAGTLAHAGTNYWSSVGSLGGELSALKFDRADPSRVLANAPIAVIWSSDGGDTWNDAYFEGRPVLAEVIAAGRSRFYVYTRSSQLLSSQDGGRTWAGATVRNAIAGLEVDAQDNRVIYATIADGTNQLGTRLVIVKSVDAGVTWTKLSPVGGQGSVNHMLADPVRAGVLYVGIFGEAFLFSNDYYKSADGGASWTLLTPQLPGGAVARLAIDTTHPDTLYVTRLANGRGTIYLARSTDGGASWQVNATNLPPRFYDRYPVVTDSVDYGTLYNGGLSVVNRSTDFGLSWSEIKTPSITTYSDMKIVAHPTRSKRLFALALDGLYRTDDAASWVEITSGINARMLGIIEIDEPRLTVHTSTVGGNDGYYSTVDRMQWNRIPAPAAPNGAAEFASPPWSARRYSIVAVGNTTHLEGDTHEALVYVSDDDGTTWTSKSISGVDVPDVLLAVSDTDVAATPQIMLGSYGIYICSVHCVLARTQLVVSNDGGTSWRKTGSVPAGTPISAAIPRVGVTTQVPVIVVALSTGIARSTDGGASFQMISTQPVGGVLFADPHRSSVLYSATTIPVFSTPPPPPLRLYRSADGGVTWGEAAFEVPLSQATGPVSDIAFSASKPDRVDVVAQNGMLVRSDDAGLTWKTLSLGQGESKGYAKFGRQEPRTAYVAISFRGVKSYTIERDAPVDVVEFYNTMLDHYFLTSSAEESLGIERGAAGPGWVRKGVAFRAWLSAAAAPFDARPVCRFYGTPGRGPNSHFYTANADECAAVRRDPGWTNEGIAFYVLPPVNDQCIGSTAVYRAYNNRFAQNDSNHRYATQRSMLVALQPQGWTVEGTAFCGASN